MSSRILGLGLAFLGVLLLSPDAGLTRLFDGDTWTMVFWRAVGNVVIIGGLALAWYRRGLLRYFHNLGWAGWALAFVAGYGSLLWLWSITLAGGAQTLALLAIAPLVAAVASWLLLGEALRMPTIICSVLALVGVVITVSDSLAQTQFSVAGLVVSLLLPVNYAMIFVLSRKVDRPNSWPLFSLGGMMLLPLAFVLAPTIALTTAVQYWSIIPMITVVATLSFALMALAARYVPASDVTLIAMLEPVLGVFFLWLIVQELPTTNQWIGGGIVLIAVTAFSLWQLRVDQRERAKARSERAVVNDTMTETDTTTETGKRMENGRATDA